MPDLEALARRASPAGLLALSRRGGMRWRLVLALIGWPPIGFAVGSLISSLTGCASFSASCPEPLPLVPIVVQPLILGTLFLVAPLAVVATFGTLIALAVALPVAAVLAVGTVPESRVGAPVLGAVVAIAYVIALVAGTRAISRSDPGVGRPPP